MDDNGAIGEIDCKENKPQNISLNLIVKRHFGPDATSWQHERIVEELNKVTHVRLDRERISSLENLLLFSNNVTNVYLQHNLIERLDGLECLINLRFITLSFNKIKVVHGLVGLCHLSLLDLSHNQIASVHEGDFPKSLMILKLKENPCASKADYRSNLVQSLPRLTQLDDDLLNTDDDSSDEENTAGNTGNVELDSGPPNDGAVGLHSATSDILTRSQRYLEVQFNQHKHRLQQLDDFRSASPSMLSRDLPLQ